MSNRTPDENGAVNQQGAVDTRGNSPATRNSTTRTGDGSGFSAVNGNMNTGSRGSNPTTHTGAGYRGGIEQGAQRQSDNYNSYIGALSALSDAQRDSRSKAMSRGPGSIAGILSDATPEARENLTETLSNAWNDKLGIRSTPEQVRRTLRTLVGESGRESIDDQAAALNTMSNRLSFGKTNPRADFGGGDVDRMLSGYDANGQRYYETYGKSGTPANDAFKNTDYRNQSYANAALAMAEALSPTSRFSLESDPTVLNATHYLTPEAAKTASWYEKKNFTPSGAHLFGNAEDISGKVAKLRGDEPRITMAGDDTRWVRPNIYDSIKPTITNAIRGVKDVTGGAVDKFLGLFGRGGEPVSTPIPHPKPAPPASELGQGVWRNPGSAPYPYANSDEQTAWEKLGNVRNPYGEPPPTTDEDSYVNDVRDGLKQSAERELAERNYVNPNLAPKPFTAGPVTHSTQTAPPSSPVPVVRAAGTPLGGYDENYFESKPIPSMGPMSSLLDKTAREKPRVTTIYKDPPPPSSPVPLRRSAGTPLGGYDENYNAGRKAPPNLAFNSREQTIKDWNDPSKYTGTEQPELPPATDRPRALGADKYGDPLGIRHFVDRTPQPTEEVVDDAGDVDRVPTAKEVFTTRKLNQSVLAGEPTTIDKLKKAGALAKDAYTIISNPLVGIPTIAGREIYKAIKGDMEKLKYLKDNYPATYTVEIARRQADQEKRFQRMSENDNGHPASGYVPRSGVPAAAGAVIPPPTDEPLPGDGGSLGYTPRPFLGMPNDFEHYGERPQHRYFARGGVVRLNRPPV